MKKILIIGLFLLTILYVQPASGQGLQTEIKVYKPNFSGSWKLNRNISKGLDEGFRIDANLQRIMIIEQSLPSVSITIKIQKGTADGENYIGGSYTLFTDGRGDTYVDEFERADSTTGWQNNKLVVTRYTYTKSAPKEVEAIQEFSLSNNGKTLTETWRRTSFKYVPDSKGNYKEERYFDDSLTLILVFDRIR